MADKFTIERGVFEESNEYGDKAGKRYYDVQRNGEWDQRFERKKDADAYVKQKKAEARAAAKKAKAESKPAPKEGKLAQKMAKEEPAKPKRLIGTDQQPETTFRPARSEKTPVDVDDPRFGPGTRAKREAEAPKEKPKLADKVKAERLGPDEAFGPAKPKYKPISAAARSKAGAKELFKKGARTGGLTGLLAGGLGYLGYNMAQPEISEPVPLDEVRKQQAAAKEEEEKKQPEEPKAGSTTTETRESGGDLELPDPYEAPDYEAMTKSLQEQLEGTGDPEAEDFAAQLAKVRADYKAAGDNLELRETIENVIHGLVNIAAGLYGQKHDLAVGPIEQKGKDWERKRDRALREYQQRVGEVQAGQAAEERRNERLEARKQRLRDRLTDLEAKKAEGKAAVARDLWKAEVEKNNKEFLSYMKAKSEGNEPDDKVRKELKKQSEYRIRNLQKALDKLEKEGWDEAESAAIAGGLPNLKEAEGWIWNSDADARKLLNQHLMMERNKLDMLSASPEFDQATNPDREQAPAAAPQSGTVTVRHIDSGKTAVLSRADAQKKLNQGGFEIVQ